MSYQKRGEPFFFSATHGKQYGFMKHRGMNKNSHIASLALNLSYDEFSWSASETENHL
jgi:hypothetical protein